MNDKILRAIEESLPSLQAKELKWFFEKYADLEAELVMIKESNKRYMEENEELRGVDRSNYKLSEREEALQKAVEKFEEELREAKIKELEYKLDAEKGWNTKVINLINTIFKNRFFNKSVCESRGLENWMYVNDTTSESIMEQEI